MKHFLLLSVLAWQIGCHPYFTSCNESTTRTCKYNGNITSQLLDLKRGGSNILSTANYESSFFPCEDYNYNCGYLQESNDPISISDGLPLTISANTLNTILPSDPTTVNLIKPYLNLTGSKAVCVLSTFPLTLSQTQSNSFMTGFLDLYAVPNINSTYSSNRKIFSSSWSSLNINIKTAVIQTVKGNMNNYSTTSFWSSFLQNDFATMSSILKSQYRQAPSSQLSSLHSAYLIDSVTIPCNKYQSINFLVDQSGSIGSSSFTQALSFLSAYVNSTLDPISLMSIHFFDSSFDPYIGYNTSKSSMLSMISSKPYRGLGTNTGTAINDTIAKVMAQSLPAGVPKLIVILTDGGSQDSVIQAANYGFSLGITFFCVGIGSNINNTQLLQIARDQSNIITISSFSSLSQLVALISNYFCKQIINIPLNSFIPGNLVRVPTSPSYFRIQKSSNISYQLQIDYASDPQVASQSSTQSMYDPFPDIYSLYNNTLSYRLNIYKKIIFIAPIAFYEVPLKQTFTQTSNVVASYLSIAATNLSFNISLKPCSTPNCSAQIAICAAIGSQSYLNGSGNGGSTNNFSIWIGIGVAIVLLGLAAFLIRLPLNKMFGQGENYNLPDGDILQNSSIHEERQNENASHKNHSEHHSQHSHSQTHSKQSKNKDKHKK